MSRLYSAEAEIDLEKIIEYTNKEYGAAQTLKYIDELEKNAENMAENYGYYRELPDIHSRLRMKHCQKHYIFGVMRENEPMLVIAIFHERMQLMTRL
ncbi:MAG: type II toxin-antitoxin system RelE/ParE family toxin, partial [Gammaproteobacteria bacterium]